MRNSLAALLLLAALPAGAECRDTVFEDTGFTLCHVTAGQDLRLFLNDPSGQVWGSFDRLEAALRAEGAHLVFAMNAGMFRADRTPAGLFVEDGAQRRPLVTREGPGNFGLLPNGVFCIEEGRFAVIESRAFAEAPPECRYATQSGPLLVIDGALHPRFMPDSVSVYIRNGVGVSGDGKDAWFVISDAPVTFHRFARFFRDVLGVPSALYLDGSLSRLYAPELGRDDWGLPMGPIVGLVAPGA